MRLSFASDEFRGLVLYKLQRRQQPTLLQTLHLEFALPPCSNHMTACLYEARNRFDSVQACSASRVGAFICNVRTCVPNSARPARTYGSSRFGFSEGAGHGGLLCCMRTSSLDYYVQWVEGTVVQAKCSERDGSAVICHQTCNTVNQAFLYDSGSSTGQLQIEHLRSSFGNY